MIRENISLTYKTILVTGASGFIGSNLIMSLLKAGEQVHIIGLDNMNDYYDVSIKEYRLSQIEKLVESAKGRWSFIRGKQLDFVTILQEELIRAKVLPEAYDFEAHKKLGPCSRVMFR